MKARNTAYDLALAIVRAYARPAPGYQLIACLCDGAPAVRAIRVRRPVWKLTVPPVPR